MISRKQKIEELLTDFHSIRRSIAFHKGGARHTPRITPAQWALLMCIEERKESTVKDAAKSLGITSSATTQLADGLVAGGYLTRKVATKDRRTVTLALSEKNRKQLKQLKKRALERFFEIFKSLTDAELNQYLTLNRKIARGFLSGNKRGTK
ncbi:MAG: MarR family transcriptional regulator [Patescibacteria group bacterium]|nr:MarR family transcriptional regulator [Patescibacteria group bacterium]